MTTIADTTMEAPEVDETEAQEPEADEAEEGTTEVTEIEEIEEAEDEDEDDEPQAAEAKVQRAVHEHKPSIAYVEMIVRKREESGSMTKAALKQYREDMLRKHGLPVGKRDQEKYLKAQAEAKAARKAAAKAERKAAREAVKAQKAVA